MILHDEIYLDTCGNGWTWHVCMSRKVCIQAKIKLVFNAICKGYTSFNSKRCQNLPNLMSFLCGIHVHPTMQKSLGSTSLVKLGSREKSMDVQRESNPR